MSVTPIESRAGETMHFLVLDSKLIFRQFLLPVYQIPFFEDIKNGEDVSPLLHSSHSSLDPAFFLKSASIISPINLMVASILKQMLFIYCCWCSVAKSCPILHDPMDAKASLSSTISRSLLKFYIYFLLFIF